MPSCMWIGEHALSSSAFESMSLRVAEMRVQGKGKLNKHPGGPQAGTTGWENTGEEGTSRSKPKASFRSCDNPFQDEEGASEEHCKSGHHREGSHDLAQKPPTSHYADVAWYNVAKEAEAQRATKPKDVRQIGHGKVQQNDD